MEEIPATKNIYQKAMRSIKWSVLMEAVTRIPGPIVTVILARLLTPIDFGVVATATIAINFSQMFWDAGLRQALIQTNDAPEEAAHVVFWSNLILSLIIYGLLFLAAPWLSVFFDNPASGPVLRVLGFQIVIASLSSVQQALFVRELDFRRLFWVKLLTAFVPGIFSIPFAFFGYGVWALVAGILVGQTLDLILLWHYSQWKPKLQYNLHLARKMFGFGAWVLAESLCAWLIMAGDKLLVGKFLGIKELGVFQMGSTLTKNLFALALNPFIAVLYPTFSRMQNDVPALIANFHKVSRIVMALVLPIGVGFLFVGPEIASIFFGSKWQGLGMVLSLFGLMWGLSWLVWINPDLYRATGRPDINVKIFLIMALVNLPAYYIAVQFDFVIFLIVRLSLVFVEIAIHIFQLRRTMGVSPLYLWHDGKNFLISALVLGLGLGIIKWGLYVLAPSVPEAITLSLLIILGIGIYIATLWRLDRSFFRQIFRLIRQVT